jgi:hypothetical protein
MKTATRWLDAHDRAALMDAVRACDIKDAGNSLFLFSGTFLYVRYLKVLVDQHDSET